MAATLLGTVGAWGVASAEPGLIISDWEHVTSSEKVYTRTINGSRKGAAFFDESIGIKVNGLIPSVTPFSGKIAASITLANAAATTHLQTASGATIPCNNWMLRLPADRSAVRNRSTDAAKASGRWLPGDNMTLDNRPGESRQRQAATGREPTKAMKQ